MKDNCFTEFCCFWSNLSSHKYAYVLSLLNPPPISLPIPLLWVDTEPLFEISETYCKFPLVAILHSVQFSSVVQSCPTLCDPMNHSMPGLPVHHCFAYGNVSFYVTLSIHLIILTHQPPSYFIGPSWIMQNILYISKFLIQVLLQSLLPCNGNHFAM